MIQGRKVIAPIFAVGHFLAVMAALFALTSCDKLGFHAESKSGATSSFAGVKSIRITPDGHYVLLWDLASGSGDVSATSYEVYMDKWAALPSGVNPIAQSLIGTDEGTTLGAKFAEIPDQAAPVGLGVLLRSVRGERSYTLDETLQPHVIYAFQVRLVNANGTRDANRQVLIYSADFNSINFAGVTGLEISQAGKLQISWDAPTELPAGLSAADLNYEIYMDSTPDTVEAVTAGALILDPGASLALNAVQTSVGIHAEFAEDKLPSSRVAVLAEKKAARFYEVETPLSPGMTYIFQVVATGPAQEKGLSKRVIVYRLEALSFAGLQAKNVTVAPDGSKIALTWEAATGNTGALSYIVYSDANFTNAIATTTSTNYDFMSPAIGHSYTFAVRAKDGSTLDANNEFVIISVPDLSDKVPPEFAGLESADVVSDKKIVLKWTVSPSTDVATYSIYNAFNLTQAIASTATGSFVVTGLTPATAYSFVVRAKDASGNEEKNVVQKSATTFAFSVPDFAGLDRVERLGGLDGLTKLKLTWLPAGSTVSGYKVYRAAAPGAEDYTTPLLDLPGGSATTTTISGLESNKTYYFVVRAYDSSSGTSRLEQNTTEKANSTLAIKAPTFAGAIAAAPGSGSLGFTTAKVRWDAPMTDGVYDSFAVQYEPGTCAQAFSASPTTIGVAGDATREFTVTGLTAQSNYRFRVRAHYSVADISDSNTACKEAFTAPPSPVFSGVSSVTTAAGISGFSSLLVAWPEASSSFSYYKIEWSTSSTFASVGGSSQVADITTLSKSLVGLPAKTLIFVRVAAVFDENGIQLGAGSSKVLSAQTTPRAPTGEGISGITVLSADSLKVTWTSPTNALSSVFNGYSLWQYCGSGAPNQLQTKLAGAPDFVYPTGQLEATFAALSSNVECCYQVRAYYDDGQNALASTSSVAAQCKTPTLVPPAFAGVATVTNANQASSFSQLSVNWTAVDVSEASLFSYYEIAYATTPSGQNWTTGTVQVADRATTSKVVTGLVANTTYYFRVRAVNNNGSPAVSNGMNAVANATTTPKRPTGDNLSAGTSISSTKVRVTYAPPNSDPAVGGLFNNVFLFVQAGSTADVTSYRTSVEAGGITAGEIQGDISAGKWTVSGVPAVIRVPMAEIAAAPNAYEIGGLTANQQICVQAVAAYWVEGQPTKYLASTTPTTRCATPVAGAPTFAGISSLTGQSNALDFTQLVVNWGAITGDCTGVQISVTQSPSAPNFTTPAATAACGDTTKIVGGLTPHTEYFVQVRAVNDVSGTKYTAGDGVELSRITKPATPSGDTVSTAAVTPVAKGPDTAMVTWTNPTTGYWNKTFVWKATGASLGAAQTAVRAAAATNAGKTGPTAARTYEYTSASNTVSLNDTGLSAGVYVCYLVKGVYSDGTYYNASANDNVACDIGAYSAPSFAGVASGAVIGTWPDGTAKIELTFVSPASGSVEEYWVYYSPSATLAAFGDLTAEPWQKVTLGDATLDANSSDNKILIGGIGNTVAGTGYYIVRYKFYFGPDADTNTAISTGVTVLGSEGNLAYVSPARSGLGYGYYMMQYEASLVSGSYGADAVAATEGDLATCNYQFHINKVANHSSCGTKASTAVVQSLKNASPTTSNFDQAWTACRGSSTAGSLMRLATFEEWTRAAKWVGTSYAAMWSIYATDSGSNCKTTGGLGLTGSRSGCKNDLELYDVAGNATEWVDSRMIRYNIDDPAGDSTNPGFDSDSERRFGYGPTIGRTIRNGIDNVRRRFHMIDPGASGLALALGADTFTPTPAERKQYGPDPQSWLEPSSNAGYQGFRCVAFAAASMPTMAQLALPQEPTYTSADYGGAAGTWTIPENMYAGDARVEAVRHRLKRFPSTGNGVGMWDFSATSTPAVIAGVYGLQNLSITNGTTIATGAGPVDNVSYYNTPTSAGAPFYAYDTAFNATTYTMGGWFYMSNWTGAYVMLLDKSGGSGSRLLIPPTGQVELETIGEGATLTASSPSPGWHHFVASLNSGGLCKLYFDGALQGSYSCISTNSGSNLYIGGASGLPAQGTLRIGPVFFVAGVAYTSTQVETVYRNLTQNGYYHQDYYYGELFGDGASITWKPWSKTVCNPTCSSSSANINYRIFRFVEPTRLSERLTTPWAIAGGINPYSTDKPLDPLAVDGSGGRLYSSSTTEGKEIFTVANCNDSTPGNCILHDDSYTGLGFSPTKIYNYMIVAQDASSNYQPAMSQRFRTPYLAGTAPTAGGASFRLEPRFRRAAAFLVDEAYQQTLARPEVMTYVPMDKSGLDHDFFIQKYEASAAAGSVVNNTPSGTYGSGAWPLQSKTNATGIWQANAAQCYDNFNQLQSFTNICGDGGLINSTSTVLQSKEAAAPIIGLDQGAMWKACRNTGISDGTGNTYYLSLASDAEWGKAADWGDLNFDGTIDVGTNAAATVASLVGTVADTTTIRCHVDNSPASAYPADSSETANCRSRYGVADMMGNVAEWTTGQIFNTNTAMDNGLDGLGLGVSISGSLAGGLVNLLRGFPVSSSGSAVSNTGGVPVSASPLAGTYRGGTWSEGGDNRWRIDARYSPWNVNTIYGGRCVK